MEFIEATAFTKYLYDYLSEDEYLGFKVFCFNIQNQAKLFAALAVLEKSAGQWLEEAKAAVFE